MQKINERIRPKLKCNDPSLTKQEFKKEADINYIMSRWTKTGSLVDPLTINLSRTPRFGDVSNVPSYMDMQNHIIGTQAIFDSLPAWLRKRFNNNPAEFYEFYMNDINNEEAIYLGLKPKPEPKPEPKPDPNPEPKQ